ncbi:hypothetical protein PVAND_002322 [Polypedilum vanderplanki]|uniref:Uncharacterized protein n=1 Tax=Polypedilum vanderplanki TaxID=319348 RepID=A0A9J6BRU2_POLVA|nr:hypothetical protein PVAND_002322 [Polypedilum vanderplanki]
MKEKLAFYVLYALLLIFLAEVNCIKINTDDSENKTITSTIASFLEKNDTLLSLEVTSEKSFQESRIINDENVKSLEISTNNHKIPPTLPNANAKKVGDESKEKLEKSIKNIAKPAQIAPSIDGKLKQAVINSKQQSFKNLVDKNTGKLKDQIAKSAENQPDISKELPPTPSSDSTAKQFIPSPELTSLFNPDNQAHNHFKPFNQFMRPPSKDASFPFENNEIDKWFGGHNRSPNEHHIHPNDVNHNFLQQHGMLRNTHVEFPHHHSDRQTNFHQHHYFPQEQYHSRNSQHSFQFNANSGERMIFPSDTPFSEEFKNNNNNWPSKLPEMNSKNERLKGTWKWIPDNNEDNESPEAKFHTFHSGPVIYDSPRPHTVRDRPYTFESTDVFNQQTTPPTGPGIGSTWPTAEALMTGEEISTTGKSDESERCHLDVKLLRSPSPWKKLIHVMTAAIPIGLIISALTPRIVYVHPNATVPTLQPPFSQQQPSPNIPPSAPNQPIPPQQLQQQFNTPFPLRQRAIIAPTYDISTSLTEFMKFMEMQYRERRENIDGICEDRFFCEMALMGAHPNANMMHRTMYKVAIETSQAQAERSGLKEIFSAIKHHNCNIFRCNHIS